MSEDQNQRLEALQREYDEVRASLPKHSVPAAMLIRLEDLEAQIDALRAALANGVNDDSPNG